MGAIAERLGLGLAAAAEREPVAGWDFEFVAVLVDDLGGPVDPVGPVAAHQDRNRPVVFGHCEISLALGSTALWGSHSDEVHSEERRDDRPEVTLNAEPEVAETRQQRQFRLRAEAANQAG